MVERIKFISKRERNNVKKFTIFFIVSLTILITGCAPKELSPEMRDLINKNGLTTDQVYKGNYYFRVSNKELDDKGIISRSKINRDEYSLEALDKGVVKLDTYIELTPKDIKNGLEFKRFESTCKEAGGSVLFDEYKKGTKQNVYGDYTDYVYVKAIYCKFKSQVGAFAFESDGDNSFFYSETRGITVENEVNEKLEKESGDVKTRLKNLGITEQDVKDEVKTGKVLTPIDVESYVLLKEVQKRKKAESESYEKSLKIQDGQQYICTDGYDSWILKYNGSMITFGDRPFRKNPVYGWYERFIGDPNPVFLDRANSTITYSGNKATCRPR